MVTTLTQHFNLVQAAMNDLILIYTVYDTALTFGYCRCDL